MGKVSNLHARARRGPAPRRGRAGTTLLELVAAISVLVIALLGVYAAQASGIGLTASDREGSVAMSDLRAAMESMLLVPLEQIPDAAGPYAPGVPIAAFDGVHLTDQEIVATYPGYAAPPVPDPLEIVLSCTWTEGGGRERELTLATLVTK